MRTLILFSMLWADWTTFGHDPQRSGWAAEETKLTRENVGTLVLKWKAKVPNEAYSLSALTAPVVASMGGKTMVYVAGIGGTVFALDGDTGAQVWSRTFKYRIQPGKGGYQGTFLCPNGITATPVIDKAARILYVIAADGALYGLDLTTGEIRYGPVQFVASYAKAWSLSLVDGVVYTTLSQGCGAGLSGFYGIDVRDRHQATVHQLLLSNTDTAGIWGRGGPVIGDNGRVYGSTADGTFDPAAGDYSNTVMSAKLPNLDHMDYYLPLNWNALRKRDLDLGSASPVYFGWKNKRLVASGTKESVVNLLDADSLGGADHQTPLYKSPLLGNENGICCSGLGIWGGLSTARDLQGQTWLYVPMGGPPASTAPEFPMKNGDTPHGSIMAFKVVGDETPKLEAAWISGDIDIPDPPVIANGIVFVLATGENAGAEGRREAAAAQYPSGGAEGAR